MGINYSSKGRIPITSKRVLKIKTKLDGIVDKFKARLLVGRFS
jgi:hypothetical protein